MTDTKQRLLHAAAEVVAVHGWAAATTRLVAQRAGVNKALVHYHFGSTEALLVAALSEAFAAEVGAGMRMVLEPDDPADGLVSFGRWLADRPADLAQDRMLVEALGQATLREDVRRVFVAALVEFRSKLADRLAARGLADATAVATAIAGLLDGIAIHRVLDPSIDATAAVAALAARVRSESPPSPPADTPGRSRR